MRRRTSNLAAQHTHSTNKKHNQPSQLVERYLHPRRRADTPSRDTLHASDTNDRRLSCTDPNPLDASAAMDLAPMPLHARSCKSVTAFGGCGHAKTYKLKSLWHSRSKRDGRLGTA